MLLNLLFVSIAFPPKNDPEALQAGRYFKALVSEFNHLAIDVVTSSNPTLFMPIDSSLNHYGQGCRQLIQFPIYENIYVNKVIRVLYPSLLSYPDSRFSFQYHSARVSKLLVQKPDLVYSRSFPLSSAFLAQRIAAHYKVPWIMHLSDPWVESPLHSYSEKVLAWHHRKEIQFFNDAQAITLTSPKTVDLYRDKYPQYANKIHLMPNVFDEASLNIEPQKQKIESKRYKFIYTGGLANTRDASPILKAVHFLANSKPELLDKGDFIFAGPMDRRNKKIFEEMAHPQIKHLGHLTASEAYQLQQQADVLLLMDSRIGDSKLDVFFPSKLLDYVVANKPILAVTGTESFSRSFIKQLKIGSAFHFDEVSEIANFIESVLNGRIVWQPDFEKINTYSASYNAKRLADLIQSLVS